jgi:hypothetical protein
MKRLLAIGGLLFGAVHTHGGDTNFVNSLNAVWRTNNASNILTFAEQSVSTNRCVETLLGRGIVAVFIQYWGRGATNYFAQAAQIVSTNTSYSVAEKKLARCNIAILKDSFTAITDDANEPQNSQPTWDTQTHALFFAEVGEELPFLHLLKEIAEIP